MARAGGKLSELMAKYDALGGNGGMRQKAATALWRRLDAPGHDACRLEQQSTGWTLDGAAVYREGDMPARITYHVDCDSEWRMMRALVAGWFGRRTVHYEFALTEAGRWTMNNTIAAELEAGLDLDFGFTPATNLQQIQRIALSEGQSAHVPVAWFDIAAGTLSLLTQRYERRSRSAYWYVAPRFKYEGLLEIGDNGFIQRYPELWEAEP